ARNVPADVVVVSNEVGMGLVPEYLLGRIFRDVLGWANQIVAQASDEVYFMVSGMPLRVKPQK
ncbi:MAG: bifunctional adenosylcobinamide kinase/adenosylcobinamide-phosphate guanylyltransferase, partial [Firmicutes bacterium]|nr:bifunctional adenosylcobinamide kinase/adenosylcobinamide-phosphate guanylyltransferase [Candidatus Fermentithermobacillaceae bacterium]